MALQITIPDPDPLKDPMQCLSRQSLSQLCKMAIMEKFWGASSGSVDWTKLRFDTFFEYFEDQCRLSLHNWDRCDGISHLTFNHVAMAAKAVREGKTRPDTEEVVKSVMDESCQELCPEVVDLTVRLLLMLQIGGFRNILMPGQETVAWIDGPLSETLNSHFSRDNVLKESVELDKTFTARNVERIAGIRIVWTNNLLDHLRMSDNDTSVALFHHASFLDIQKDSPIFPEGLISETIQTLSLLLPLNERDTTSWFLKQQIELHLDNEAVRCKSLRKEERTIDNFAFWRDRLVILKQVFDEAKPSTLQQAWADRRNPSQWYNFWIAGFLILALTVLLGLIQAIEGALQVYKAYHPT